MINGKLQKQCEIRSWKPKKRMNNIYLCVRYIYIKRQRVLLNQPAVLYIVYHSATVRRKQFLLEHNKCVASAGQATNKPEKWPVTLPLRYIDHPAQDKSGILVSLTDEFNSDSGKHTNKVGHGSWMD